MFSAYISSKDSVRIGLGLEPGEVLRVSIEHHPDVPMPGDSDRAVERDLETIGRFMLVVRSTVRASSDNQSVAVLRQCIQPVIRWCDAHNWWFAGQMECRHLSSPPFNFRGAANRRSDVHRAEVNVGIVPHLSLLSVPGLSFSGASSLAADGFSSFACRAISRISSFLRVYSSMAVVNSSSSSMSSHREA